MIDQAKFRDLMRCLKMEEGSAFILLPKGNILIILIKMKSIVFGLLMSIFGIAFGQESECYKFKTGKFEIHSTRHGTTEIVRKRSKQVEYSEAAQLKLVYKVKWLDDCTYTLVLKKILQNPHDILLSKEVVLTVKIVQTKENSYWHKTTSNLSDYVLEGEIFKIE